MNQPITQVLTVYSVAFIMAVKMGGNTTAGPNDIFISYLIFIIQATWTYQSQSSEAWNEVSSL